MLRVYNDLPLIFEVGNVSIENKSDTYVIITNESLVWAEEDERNA